MLVGVFVVRRVGEGLRASQHFDQINLDVLRLRAEKGRKEGDSERASERARKMGEGRNRGRPTSTVSRVGTGWDGRRQGRVLWHGFDRQTSATLGSPGSLPFRRACSFPLSFFGWVGVEGGRWQEAGRRQGAGRRAQGGLSWAWLKKRSRERGEG